MQLRGAGLFSPRFLSWKRVELSNKTDILLPKTLSPEKKKKKKKSWRPRLNYQIATHRLLQPDMWRHFRVRARKTGIYCFLYTLGSGWGEPRGFCSRSNVSLLPVFRFLDVQDTSAASFCTERFSLLHFHSGFPSPPPRRAKLFSSVFIFFIFFLAR